MNTIYLIVGAPGSGKSWVCGQLTDNFEYIPHDLYPKTYLEEVLKRVKTATKPLLIETPFSVSKYMDALKLKGFKVIPVFIIETVEVTSERYLKRGDLKPEEYKKRQKLLKGHLTRIETYKQRAKELNAFSGTSNEVLNHLNGLNGDFTVLDIMKKKGM